MLFFVVIIFYFSYLRKIIKINNGATEGLVQQLLQRIWAIGLMGSWFCIWDYFQHPKTAFGFTFGFGENTGEKYLFR
nr:hypothetical protein [uncultured Flavobacterium sp.]